MITINGKTFSNGDTINIVNGQIFVDGRDVTDDQGGSISGIVRVEVNGDIHNLNCDISVEVKGNITGDVRSGGSVHCKNIGGSLNCGGSVHCDKVNGNIIAGGSVKHK